MKPYIAKKIYPTNFIIKALIFGLAIPFTIISYFFFDWLMIFPALGGLACTSAYYLIKKSEYGIYIARFVVCLVPMLLAAAYNAYLSGSDGQPLPALYLCQGSFLLIPFVVYDLSEVKSILANTLICLTIILTFEYQNGWMVSEIPSEIMRHGWLMQLTVILAMTTSIGLILGLAILNKQEMDANINAQKVINDKIAKEEEVAQENERKLRMLEDKNNRENYVKDRTGILSEKVIVGYQEFLSELCKHFSTVDAVMFEGNKKIAGYASVVEDEVNLIEIALYRQVFATKRQEVVLAPAGFSEFSTDQVYSIITPIQDLFGNVIGIIELASIKKPQDKDMELLRSAATVAGRYLGLKLN